MKPFITFVLWAFFASGLAAETKITEVTSAGGITAWFVEEQSIPIVSISLSFQGGASLDPIEKQGATNLMMGLLEEGAGALDASGFLEASDDLGARFSFRAGRDSVNISASMLKSDLAESVALLRLALVSPNFDEIAFERVRGQVNSSIRSSETDPNSLAGMAFNQLVYGDHPYGRDRDGTLETVAALTPDDMRVAHQRSLTKDRLVIGVVGAITPNELGLLLDDLLADLPDTSIGEVPDYTVATTAGVTVIDLDTPQSVAIFGHRGLARDDPDFLTAFVLNHIMGGRVSTARLNVELREKRGLTYGISSYLLPYRHAATFLGQFSSNNDSMAEAVELVKAEWAKMAEFGITQAELDVAVRYLTGAYPLRFEGNGAIAGIITGLQVANLPIDYPQTRNDQVRAVTLEEMNRVAAKIFLPEELLFVIVGRPEGL
ncbi:MAG: insulinase family protein [Rhodobacteraceae bacterium]|nr:insulinase family protein [Paracoccaceae bacterium]